MNEWQLLRLYVENRSEQAFSQLAGRYVNLVFATCLREIGDYQLAEDATQVVFLLLARKAPILPRTTILSGWLFRTACFVAKNMRRSERRRALAEREAVGQELISRHLPEKISDGSESEWKTIEPHLHAALSALRGSERNILLLRFFEDRSLSEVGAVLGLSEDAARMRVMRALEKLRRILAKSGSTVPTMVLAGLLTKQAVPDSRTDFADVFPQIAVAGSVAAKAAGVLTGWHIYQLTQVATKAFWKANLKTAAVALGIGVAAVGTVPVVLNQIQPPSPPHASMQMSVGADTKAEAARFAAQQIVLQQIQSEALAQESARLAALLQRPGNGQRLDKSLKANPRLLLPATQVHWGKIRLPSGQVVRGITSPTFFSLRMASIRRMEHLIVQAQKANRNSGNYPISAAPGLKFFPKDSVVTVDLSYGKKRKLSTVKLTGSYSQVIHQLSLMTQTKPHKKRKPLH